MTTSQDAARSIAGRYQLGRLVGRGGMGVVWCAEDTLLRRTVALKEVEIPPSLPDRERKVLRERVLREARAAARLHDPAAVTVYDVVEEDGRPCIVMELVDARTLSEVIRDDGPLPPHRVAEIGVALLGALTAAHAAGIVHRDVKPGNVLISGDGRVRLTDFGIAVSAGDPSLTSTGLLLGSPAYIAPERARGDSGGPPSDLWALGATLYAAVEGVPPFEGDNPLTTLAAVVENRRRPPRLAGPLVGLLEDLLDPDPERRPVAAEVGDRLRRAAAEEPIPALAPPPGGTRTRDQTVPVSIPAGGQDGERKAAEDRRDEGSADDAGAGGPDPYPDGGPVPADGAAAASRTGRGTPPYSSRPRPAARPAEPAPRRRGAWVAAGLALLLVAGLVAFLSQHGRSRTPAAASGSVPSARPSAKASASHSAAPSGTPSASSSAPAPGLTTYREPSGSWTIGYPTGWQVSRSGIETYFRDPATHDYVQVDTQQPADFSAQQDWERYETVFKEKHPDYQRIYLGPCCGDPDGRKHADWEFTFGSGGTREHGRDRGQVSGGVGYAVYFQSSDATWKDREALREAVYASFKPST